MKHLDLFSGIGGFALAVDTVWPESTHEFCEIDPYCREILKLRFPGSIVNGDIKNFGRDAEETRYFDFITGGVPCQPFSTAGKRKGVKDNRYLWPEMFRIIKKFSSRWVIVKNVRGLLSIQNGMVFEQICLDLESTGYEVQAFVIPAVAVNAPHRRDRIWIVGYSKGNDKQWNGECEGKSQKSVRGPNSNAPDSSSDRFKRERQEIEIKEGLQQRLESAGELARGFEGSYSDVTNTRRKLRKQKDNSELETDTTQRTASEFSVEPSDRRNIKINPDSDNQRLQRHREDGKCSRKRSFRKSDWEEDWREVAFRTCLRGVDDGLPAGVDGLKLSKSRHRQERLKALGNSIVPQIAINIFKSIKFVEEK